MKNYCRQLSIMLSLVMILCFMLAGCGQENIPFNDIVVLPSDMPVSVSFIDDDPSIEPLIITDHSEISTILSTLNARAYREVKTVTPKSNARLKFVYDNGTEILVSLHGITDSSGKKYEPVSDDGLENTIKSFLGHTAE